SWGRNQNGQLGLGNTEDSLVPRKVEAFQGISIKMFAAGAEHTVAVTEDGELYGWGCGRYGNLGLGDRGDRLVPGIVSAVVGEKMVLVACGWRHAISVSSSGSLYTCGWIKYGQLGHGDFEDHLIPHKLDSLGGNCISRISGGWRHTMAVTADGKLYGWGWNKIVALSRDGSSGQCLEISKADVSSSVTKAFSSEKSWVSSTDRYAVVPDENLNCCATSFSGTSLDASWLWSRPDESCNGQLWALSRAGLRTYHEICVHELI
ncbi:hypothetical protein F511_08459, partial [Dorcoceras hygrometricum]